MSSEPHVDPRGRTVGADARRNREFGPHASTSAVPAWLAGPSEEERQEWARRYRWRGALGLEESRLGPTREDIDLWAEREHKRRQAWLDGPNAVEKHDWAEQQRRHAHGARLATTSAPAPTADEIEAWAARERQRRQQWLDGPSEEEKQQWARQQRDGFFDELASLPDFLESQLPENGGAVVCGSRACWQRRPLCRYACAATAMVVFRSRRQSRRRRVVSAAAAPPRPLLSARTPSAYRMRRG